MKVKWVRTAIIAIILLIIGIINLIGILPFVPDEFRPLCLIFLIVVDCIYVTLVELKWALRHVLYVACGVLVISIIVYGLILISQPSSLNGSISMMDGTPAANEVFIIEDSSATPHVVTLDAKGKFAVTGLPQGVYIISKNGVPLYKGEIPSRWPKLPSNSMSSGDIYFYPTPTSTSAPVPTTTTPEVTESASPVVTLMPTPFPTPDPMLALLFWSTRGQVASASDPAILSATYTHDCAHDEGHSNDIGLRLETKFTSSGQSSWITTWPDAGINLLGKALKFYVKAVSGGGIFYIEVANEGSGPEIISSSIRPTQQATWVEFSASINRYFGSVIPDRVKSLKFTFKSVQTNTVICIDDIRFESDISK